MDDDDEEEEEGDDDVREAIGSADSFDVGCAGAVAVPSSGVEICFEREISVKKDKIQKIYKPSLYRTVRWTFKDNSKEGEKVGKIIWWCF